MLTQLFTFVVIGGGAAVALIGVSAAAVTIFRNVPAWVVYSICHASFVLPVYLLHRRFSFNSTAAHGRALPRYIAVQAMSFGLAALLSYIAYTVLGLLPLIASTAVTVSTSAFSFVVSRYWAFANSGA